MKLYLIKMHSCFHVVYEFAKGKFQLLGSAKLRTEMVSKLNEKGISEHACHAEETSPEATNWLHIYLSINNMWNLVYEPLTLTPELHKALEAPCKLKAPQGCPFDEGDTKGSWHVEPMGSDFKVVKDVPKVQEQGEFDINWGQEGAPTFTPRRYKPNHFSIL